MLTLDPSSACPVCAKKYHPELLPPYLTTCGHTFCLPCLQDLDAPKCPTCHDTLQITRVRQVHIDVARSDSAGHSHVRRKEPPVRPPDAVLEVVRDLEYKLAKALGRSHEDTLRACNEVQDWIEKADATYAHEKLVLLTFSDLALKRVEFERAPPSADTKKIEDLMAMLNRQKKEIERLKAEVARHDEQRNPSNPSSVVDDRSRGSSSPPAVPPPVPPKHSPGEQQSVARPPARRRASTQPAQEPGVPKTGTATKSTQPRPAPPPAPAPIPILRTHGSQLTVAALRSHASSQMLHDAALGRRRSQDSDDDAFADDNDNDDDEDAPRLPNRRESTAVQFDSMSSDDDSDPSSGSDSPDMPPSPPGKDNYQTYAGKINDYDNIGVERVRGRSDSAAKLVRPPHPHRFDGSLSAPALPIPPASPPPRRTEAPTSSILFRPAASAPPVQPTNALGFDPGEDDSPVASLSQPRSLERPHPLESGLTRTQSQRRFSPAAPVSGMTSVESLVIPDVASRSWRSGSNVQPAGERVSTKKKVRPSVEDSPSMGLSMEGFGVSLGVPPRGFAEPESPPTNKPHRHRDGERKKKPSSSKVKNADEYGVSTSHISGASHHSGSQSSHQPHSSRLPTSRSHGYTPGRMPVTAE